MYYVYLLHSSKTGKFYVGSTSDLRQRFHQHNQGYNISTRDGLPWELVNYEAFTTKALALELEHKLKHHGRGLVELKKRIGFR